MSHRAHRWLLNWVLGGVSQQVVNSCTAPVLVVKDQKYCQIN
ncbi:universal stress protein [Candidatus Bathyarchaeota archaeon]|nr:MAG: universal stress protein [Candidatus Bathyarchaeota archaeon]